jgi:ubiquitin C-terminal hydrolase
MNKDNIHWYANDNTNCELIGLENIHNSCYMDSILMALFANPNEYILNKLLYTEPNYNNDKCSKSKRKNKKYLQQIQLLLNVYFKKIHGYGNLSPKLNNVTLLRKYIGKCKHGKKFNTGRMEESGEFLLFLFDIFDVNGGYTRTQTIYDINNNVTGDIIINKNASIYTLDSFTLRNFKRMYKNKPVKMDKLLTTITYNEFSDPIIHKNKPYLFTYQIHEYIDSPYFVIWLLRQDPITEKKNKLLVEPGQSLYIRDTKIRRQLISIIIHIGNTIHSGHYVTMFNCNNNWYLYDDIRSNIKYIGSYNNMINHKLNPRKNGVLFFYTKIINNK